MVKIDMKDLFCGANKKYLRFRWKDQTYQFNCLPFGLLCASWIFTNITKAVTAVLKDRWASDSSFIWKISWSWQNQRIC